MFALKQPFYLYFILMLLVFPVVHSNAQTRQAVVLNMNHYNLETNNSRYQATLNLMRLTGIPFDTTSSLDTALLYPVVITASRFSDSALTTTQTIQLKNYVSSGGVIITSALRDTSLLDLFGISTTNSDNTLTTLTWDTTGLSPYFSLVNDSLEVNVSVGDPDEVNFYTRVYTLSTGQQLAHYEDGRTAAVINSYGSGKTYLLGPDFRDVVLRNQLNMDLEAQRVYSNGFEVSTDVFVFVVRNIIRSHIPNSVYAYTVPGNASSVLLVTHDVDSRTSIDTMHIFSTYETSRGISAQYNITTRYMHDQWMSDYYPGHDLVFDSLLMHGHIMASHSVGHFPDFANDSIFPFGTTGNTMASYTPAYLFGATSGGSILGELEVSKNIIEGAYGVPVRSFRAGHLCFPDSLGLALQTLGYDFNSTQSANDVLTAFPHYLYEDRAFSSKPSSVLEIPMTISDVFKDNPIADTNHLLKVNIWIRDIKRYAANNAPVTLLIHPNRTFKLDAFQHLLDSLPLGMITYRFQDYGDYWRKRDSLQFHTVLSNDTLYVYMDNDKLSYEQSFVIDHLGLDTVRFFNDNGTELTFQHQPYSGTQRLYYRAPLITGVPTPQEQGISFNVFPNPATGMIAVTYDHMGQGVLISVIDLSGRVLYNERMPDRVKWLDMRAITPEQGVYLICLTNGRERSTRKLVYIKE